MSSRALSKDRSHCASEMVYQTGAHSSWIIKTTLVVAITVEVKVAGWEESQRKLEGEERMEEMDLKKEGGFFFFQDDDNDSCWWLRWWSNTEIYAMGLGMSWDWNSWECVGEWGVCWNDGGDARRFSIKTAIYKVVL